MKRYIEASPRAKKVFFIVAFIWAGVALFLAGYDAWFPISDVPQEQLVQISTRALVAVVVSVVFYLALSILVVLYAVWTVRGQK
jgi:phosphoglycerol transferase MdoB-like AlkP superfamily enzyme